MSSEEKDAELVGSDEEEELSDEEVERGSSEEGSDDEEDDDEDEDEDDEDEEGSDDDSPSHRSRKPPRKKSKPFVAPPPRELPTRTTRGARMTSLVTDEGDEEFWNQEFFAEEEGDARYETESEPEDRFDADFNESEDEGDDEAEAAEAEAEALQREPKRKVLKPPGYKKPPLPRPKPKPAAAAAAAEGSEGGAAAASGGGGARRKSTSGITAADYVPVRRTVRDSTRQKVEEGEAERRAAEKYKPKRSAPRASTHRPLTQAELLAEAARTEIENTRSLQWLEMIEEETKRKAAVHKRRYAGPMVRWKSRRVGDAEVSTLEIRNMAMPDALRPRAAPAPPPPALCAVTGAPARYRDPATGLPYATLEAFKELRRRRDAGLLAPQAQAAAAAAAAGAAAGAAAAAAGLSPGSGQALRASARQSSRLAAQQQAGALGGAGLSPGQEPLYQPELLFQQFEAAPGLQLGFQQPAAAGAGAAFSPAAFFPPGDPAVQQQLGIT